MQARKLLLILGMWLGMAALPAMIAESPERTVPTAGPLLFRQRVLDELARFRKMKEPGFSSVDPDLNALIHRDFEKLQTQARIALAWTGDATAITELVKQFELDSADADAWARKHSELYLLIEPTWPAEMRQVVQALEAGRPELARKVRRRMMHLWQLGLEREGDEIIEAILGPPSQEEPAAQKIERLTLAELKKEALEDGRLRGLAMLRWARLDPEAALPGLACRLNDGKQEVSARHEAARALADRGDRRGLDWLKSACLDAGIGLGGDPGVSLLEAGEAGVTAYFRLIEEFIKKNPGKELPYALAEAPRYCSRETYFKHLPRLLRLKDDRAHYKVRSRLDELKLSARELTFLIEHLRAGKYKDVRLFESLRWSLWGKGPSDRFAREVAELWVDELQSATDPAVWEQGARIHLQTRLGAPETAAAGARRHLKSNTRLACQVLAEVGKSEDVALIWEATHGLAAKQQWVWYDLPAHGWLAIIRLTNHVTPPKAKPR